MISSDSLILLDTNIVVHLARQDELGRRLEQAYRLSSRAIRPLISIVTVGELLAFARKRSWGASKEQALREAVGQLSVVDIRSEQVLDRYAELDAYSERLGRRMGQNDLWIAAAAAATEAVLLTTDQDFDHLDPSHLRREMVTPSP